MHAQLLVWSCYSPRSWLQTLRWCSRSASSDWVQTSLHVLLTMRRGSCSSNQTCQRCHCTGHLQSHQSKPALVYPWGLALTRYMSRKTLLLFWFEPALDVSGFCSSCFSCCTACLSVAIFTPWSFMMLVKSIHSLSPSVPCLAMKSSGWFVAITVCCACSRTVPFLYAWKCNGEKSL